MLTDLNEKQSSRHSEVMEALQKIAEGVLNAGMAGARDESVRSELEVSCFRNSTVVHDYDERAECTRVMIT